MNRQILVTGGCGGLGTELVKKHLYQGDHVIAAGRQISDEIQSLIASNPLLSFVACDISSTQNTMESLGTLSASIDKIDILYHTAGIYRFEDKAWLPDTDLDAMGTMYNINAVGFLRVLKALWEKIHHTAIICVTSEAGSIGNNFRSWEYGYCMSKCAENMAAAIAQHHFDELGNESRIMCLHPGWLRTKMGGADAFQQLDKSVDPAESAANIKNIAENIHSFPKDVMYMDHLQNILPW